MCADIIKKNLEAKEVLFAERLRINHIYKEFMEFVGKNIVPTNNPDRYIGCFTLKEFLDYVEYNYKLISSKEEVDFIVSKIKEAAREDKNLRMETLSKSGHVFFSRAKRMASKVLFSISFYRETKNKVEVSIPYCNTLAILNLRSKDDPNNYCATTNFMLWDYVEEHILKPEGYSVKFGYWDIQHKNQLELILVCMDYKKEI